MIDRMRHIGRRRFLLSLLPAALLAFPVVLFDLWNLRTVLHFVAASGNAGDSWNAMRAAWTWFVGPHEGSLYQQVLFVRHIKFQYPPSSLLLFELGAILHLDFTNHALNCVSYAMLGLQAVAAGYLAWVAVQTLVRPARKILPWAVAIPVALLTLDFGPALIAAALGQVQTWINAWFVVACVCWVKDRRLFAGMCIGAICLFKPQFGLFLLWGASRREGSFLLGWAAVVIPGLAFSLFTFGVANHLDYFPALQFLSRHGEVYFANQSVNGLLNRFLGNGNSAVFQPDGFPPYHPLVYFSALATTVVLIAAALLYRVRSRRACAIDFCIAGFTFTLASPIAWNHHYGILPSVFVLAAVSISAVASPLKRGALACALVVLWTLEGHWAPPSASVRTGAATLLESTMFLAALGLLAMLYLLRDVYAVRIAPRLENAATHSGYALSQALMAEPGFEAK